MDAADLLQLLRRRWLAVVVCVLAGITGALSVTRSTDESYRASARLFVNVSAARGIQEALQGVQLTTGLLQSYAEVATSLTAAQRIIDDLELDLSPGALRGKLSAEPQGDTLLVTISATDHDPAQAQLLANAAAEVFIDLIAEFERGRPDKIEARVIDGASRPSTPIAPRPGRNLLLGSVFGLGSGVALALLLESVDRSVKTAAQAAAITGRPLLAVVPKRKRAEDLIAPGDSDPSHEAFRSLRTAIRFLAVDHPLRSILVTSPAPDEGKTTTAVNLALAFAESGARVVLVDADLRRARLADIFEVEGDVGVTSVLTGEVHAAQALVEVRPNLLLLPAGPTPPNPAELVGSEAMARLLVDLDDPDRVDVVIVDAPPVLPVTDAVALSPQVHAVILVLRAGRTRRDAAEETVRRLGVVSAEVIGCVLNAVPRRGAAQYRQEYRYAARPRG